MFKVYYMHLNLPVITYPDPVSACVYCILVLPVVPHSKGNNCVKVTEI